MPEIGTLSVRHHAPPSGENDAMNTKFSASCGLSTPTRVFFYLRVFRGHYIASPSVYTVALFTVLGGPRLMAQCVHANGTVCRSCCIRINSFSFAHNTGLFGRANVLSE